jgi:plastocyanin
MSDQAVRTATAGLLLALVAVGAASQEEIRIEASRSGFKPKVVTLHKGDRARLVLTTADEEHCFAVDQLRIEKRIVRGKATTVDLTVDRSGTYPFHCCLEPGREAMRGRLVVSE